MDLDMWGIGWNLGIEEYVFFLDWGDGRIIVLFGLDIAVLCVTFEVNFSTQT